MHNTQSSSSAEEETKLNRIKIHDADEIQHHFGSVVQETLRMMEMAVMVTSFQIQNLSKQSSSSAPFQNRHPHQSFSMSVVIMPPNLGTLAQPKYTYE